MANKWGRRAIHLGMFLAAVVLWIIFLMLTQGRAYGQTLTNADLNKPHRAMQDARTAAKILAPHQWQPPPYVPKRTTFDYIAPSNSTHGPFGELRLTPTPPAPPFIAPYWATWPPYMTGGLHGFGRPTGSRRSDVTRKR